jgi:molecular chaperone GrpE
MRKKTQATEEEIEAESLPDGAAAESVDGQSTQDEEPADVGAQETPEPVMDAGEPELPDDGESAYIVALQAELDDARHQIEDAEKRLKYLQAEFQNFRRRKEEEQKDLQKFSNSELIRELLPVIDNFERALTAADRTKNFDALVAGVSGTLKQLQTFLQKAGVKSIEAVGKEFDPNFHEAIGHSDDAELPANTVAEEVQRGYTMHDRVLRPTLVKVSGG